MHIQSMSEIDWRAKLSTMPIPLSIRKDSLLSNALARIIDGSRISKTMGADLHRHSSLPGISALAKMIKQSRFDNLVFFNANLHVNTTKQP